MGVSRLRATINVLKRRFPGKSVSSTAARPDGEQGGGEKDSQISPCIPARLLILDGG
jgi:hypothetical protein